jgi:hypothetical protein
MRQLLLHPSCSFTSQDQICMDQVLQQLLCCWWEPPPAAFMQLRLLQLV